MAPALLSILRTLVRSNLLHLRCPLHLLFYLNASRFPVKLTVVSIPTAGFPEVRCEALSLSPSNKDSSRSRS